MKAAGFLKLALAAGVLLVLVYVMANGIGLVDSLDFGAGAYYYADIPEFDKLYTSAPDFSDTAVLVVAFFAIWGLVIFGLLKLLKALPKPVDSEQDNVESDDDSDRI